MSVSQLSSRWYYCQVLRLPGPVAGRQGLYGSTLGSLGDWRVHHDARLEPEQDQQSPRGPASLHGPYCEHLKVLYTWNDLLKG